MIPLTEDKLFRLLRKIQRRPELLLGEKSIVALESFISGYLYACKGDCDSHFWYEQFLEYVAKRCGIKEPIFRLSEVFKNGGYTDSAAVDYFMELLEQFAKSTDGFNAPHADPTGLSDGEIRVFRVDQSMATSFISDTVQSRARELFGVPCITEQQVLLFQWETDGTLTCALCSDVNCVQKLSSSAGSMPPILQEMKVHGATDKITFTTVKE